MARVGFHQPKGAQSKGFAMTTASLLDLSHFTGSMDFHATTLKRERFVATDGMAYVAEECSAYWLLDLAASYQGARLDRACEGFQVWTLRKLPDGCKNAAVAECWRDSGDAKPVLRQLIPFTDFPFDRLGSETFRFFVEGFGTHRWTALLPSEH